MLGTRITKWITTLSLALLLHCAAFGQAVNNAQIHGVVQDPTGAAVIGAQVKATRTDTGVSQTTISGADGFFIIPGLPVGGYSLEVTAKAFSKYLQTGLVLEVGQNVQVNVSLSVGSVTEEVHVSSDAAMVETQDTSISQVIDIGGGSNSPATFIRNQWQWSDDVDWIRGKNHYSFGIEGIAGQMDQNNIQDANGSFTFDGTLTGRPASGGAAAAARWLIFC